jgi:hypothetical protein
MDKQTKKDWIKALRSGEYPQGYGKLHSSEGKFCCLGVLCDIALDSWWELDSSGEKYKLGGGYSYMPPIDLIDDLGPEVCLRLANLNDKGKSFDEIAAYIEINL